MRVLIIEPSASFRRLLATLVAETGCQCTTVEDANEALIAIEKYQYGAITLSKYVEGLDYRSLVSQIRGMENYRTVPLLLITSEDRPQTVNEALACGLTDVFAKNDLDLLTNSLTRILKRARLRLNGRVLYVEDSASLSQFVTGLLENLGLEVLAFRNAEDAVEALKTESIDLVVTDILLEGPYSGLRLMREIRAMDDEEKRTVPILAVTGFSDPARRVEILNLGADDYVSKPIFRDEFISRVQNIMIRQQLVHKLRQREADLQRMALFDGLSGLYNRHGMDSVGARIIKDIHTKQTPLTFALVDLDHFKQINDGYGHQVGDAVIAEMGRAILDCIRVDDVAARWGGDEFAIIMPGVSNDEAVATADRIRQRFLQASPCEEANCSIGIAEWHHGQDQELSQLFERSDQALYQCKAAGRGVTRSYKDIG
jgi:two-component system cell cycle response regulator